MRPDDTHHEEEEDDAERPDVDSSRVVERATRPELRRLCVCVCVCACVCVCVCVCECVWLWSVWLVCAHCA